MREYWAMLRRDMKWWNWVAMFVIVVVAPPALLIWLAASGKWLAFATALIALIGAMVKGIHAIQRRQS
jgi:hypothetical protein